MLRASAAAAAAAAAVCSIAAPPGLLVIPQAKGAYVLGSIRTCRRFDFAGLMPPCFGKVGGVHFIYGCTGHSTLRCEELTLFVSIFNLTLLDTLPINKMKGRQSSHPSAQTALLRGLTLRVRRSIDNYTGCDMHTTEPIPVAITRARPCPFVS
ncbi:hypothetical protein EJ06DRAFT_338600 [Trichodelitschia bisporula]|uniref:Secreted protein n=1 Tax=Trichodelitschia bisporula TaxID=703511 RepID=A0A6G1I369_9PEZI|nr:hypothetical protein EJ06DRAFT_338600 [Trichodelitschia bisporula]